MVLQSVEGEASGLMSHLQPTKPPPDRHPHPPQDELLKKAAVQARSERDRREAAATVSERVELNARANEKKKELRKEEVGWLRFGLVCARRCGSLVMGAVRGLTSSARVE